MLAAGKVLGEAGLRKQALLLESQLNRIELSHAYRSLNAAGRPAARVARMAGKFSPWLLFGGAVMGLFAVRRVGRFSGALGAAMRLAEWAPNLYSLWAKWSPARRAVEEPFDPEALA